MGKSCVLFFSTQTDGVYAVLAGGAVFLAGRFGTARSQSQVPGAGELHQHRLVSRVARGSAALGQPEIPQRSRPINGKMSLISKRV